MKVCLFVDSYLPEIGGLQFAVHHLGNALIDKGLDVTIIAKRTKQKFTIDIPKYNYNLVRYGYTFKGSGRLGADNFSGILSLLKSHRKKNFDIINVHNVTYAATRARIAKPWLKTPLVLTPHGDDIETVPEINYGVRLIKKWDRIINKNLASAQAITTISKNINKEICAISKKKTFNIPNGINLKNFVSQKDDYLFNLLEISPNTKIVLSVGRYDIVKGFEYGVEAFKRIVQKSEIKNLVYVIVGLGSENLKPLIGSLALSQKVFLLPNLSQENLARCYNSSWCFFSPSVMEGLSLVSLEAMACGLPLVVTDVPGNIDIVEKNKCGIIVKNRNIVSMANGITNLYNNDKLYNQLANNALENIPFYDWNNIAGMYIDAYKEVLNQ